MEVNSDSDGITLFFACLGQSKHDLYQGQVAIHQLLHEYLPNDQAKRFEYTNVSWYKAAQDESSQFDGYLVQVWNGFLLPNDNNEAAWVHIVHVLWEMCKDNPHILLDVELKGGAISSVNSSATAFPWRNATYNLGVVVYVSPAEHHAESIFANEVQRVGKLWNQRVAPQLHGTFANYAMTSLRDLPKQTAAELAWDDNSNRLSRIKVAYDPSNIFHHPGGLSIPLPELIEATAMPTTTEPSSNPTLLPTASPTEVPTTLPTIGHRLHFLLRHRLRLGPPRIQHREQLSRIQAAALPTRRLQRVPYQGLSNRSRCLSLTL